VTRPVPPAGVRGYGGFNRAKNRFLPWRLVEFGERVGEGIVSATRKMRPAGSTAAFETEK